MQREGWPDEVGLGPIQETVLSIDSANGKALCNQQYAAPCQVKFAAV
jgi:hypothetical protein